MQRHIRRTLLAIAVLSVFVIPVAVNAASDGFTDVDDTNVFKADIDWLAAAEVTKGCNPPANTLFCPKDTVTRETMAAFMHRLAVNKVVDAKTAETAKNADNADLLDGVDSSELLTNETIVMSTPSTAWTPNSGATPSTSDIFTNIALFSGDGVIQMPLVTPSSIGGTTFGMKSLEICYLAQVAPGTIDAISIRRGIANEFASLVFTDDTNRTSSTFTCFTVQPNLLAGRGLSLSVVLSNGGTIAMGSVTATWTSDLTGLSGGAGDSTGDQPGAAPSG